MPNAYYKCRKNNCKHFFEDYVVMSGSEFPQSKKEPDAIFCIHRSVYRAVELQYLCGNGKAKPCSIIAPVP